MTRRGRCVRRPTRAFVGVGARLGGIAILFALALTSLRGALPARASDEAACPIERAAPRPGVDYDSRFTLVTFTNQCGQSVSLAVDIAADEARRETGLMNIAVLPADQGELFVFTDIAHAAPVRIGFWMKDTLVPLSVAFIGADGTVQEIQDMQPETLDTHVPAEPYLYAIEANQGWFAKNGIAAGSHGDLQPALALTH